MRKGSFFEVVPGIELYYEVNGDGPPLVFIPGWTFTTEVFDQQVAYFSKTHKVVSFDPRCQGRSTISVHGVDYSAQSTDLCKLIDYLKLDKPVLVGWSFGCLPLWGVVRIRGTESLGGLVFIDMPPVPVPCDDTEWMDMSFTMATDFYQALTTPSGHRELVSEYVQEAFVQRKLSEQELDWMVRQSTSCPHWAAAAYAAAGSFSNYQSEAQQADKNLPTMFIVNEDSLDRAESYITKHFPNAMYEFLGGHMMFWEHPDKFNTTLQAYLEKLE